jgi:hypothetical protein
MEKLLAVPALVALTGVALAGAPAASLNAEHAEDAPTEIVRIHRATASISGAESAVIPSHCPAGAATPAVTARRAPGTVVANRLYVTANGAGPSQLETSPAVHSTTPEDFGAWGDYVPSTATGHDDTAALQAALNSGKAVRLANDRIYKVTAKLTVPNGTTVRGAGYRTSLIWCAMPDASTDCVQLGPASEPGLGIQLLNFGIVGGRSPGQAALAAWSLAISQVDVYLGGGWEYLLRVWREATGIHGPEGGGFEENHVRIWHTNWDSSLPFSPALSPNPKRGIYIRGWTNGSNIYARIGTTTVGDGLHIEGTYSAANNSRLSGSYQGIAGWGVYVGGNCGHLTRIEDVHAEVVGSGGVYVGAVQSPSVRHVYGSVTIDGAKDAEVGHISGVLTITETSQRTRIVGPVTADNRPIVNHSATTSASSFATAFANGGARGDAFGAPASESNLILNGDFARFLSTTDHAPSSVWGVSGPYTATRTGIGLADTTHTSESGYAALMSHREGTAGAAYWPILEPSAVPTSWVGMPVTASFKWKNAIPGAGWLGAIEMPRNTIGAGYGFAVDQYSSDAGDGWKRYDFTFLLTPAHIANGVGLQLAFVNSSGKPSYYIADVQAVLGVSSPRTFNRRTRDKLGIVDILLGGRLSTFGTSAPTSGGDPVFNSTWRPGDLVLNSAATAGSPLGWRNVGSGTPGRWEPLYSHAAEPSASGGTR